MTRCEVCPRVNTPRDHGENLAGARALLAALRGPGAEAILKDKGMEPAPAN